MNLDERLREILAYNIDEYGETSPDLIAQIKAAFQDHCEICENRWMQCKCGQEGRREKLMTGKEWLERFELEMALVSWVGGAPSRERIEEAARKASGTES